MLLAKLRSISSWYSARYVRICLIPSLVFSLVQTLFFASALPSTLAVQGYLALFIVTTIVSVSVGSCVLFGFGVGAILFQPIRQKHDLGIFRASMVSGIVVCAIASYTAVYIMLKLPFGEMGSRVIVFYSAIIFIAIAALAVYEQMRRRLEATLEQLQAKEVSEQILLKLKAQAELASLQARINPHFLFNSLNSIASLIVIDPKRAESAVELLSKLLRFSLRSSERRVVLLSEEFEIIKIYLQLEKMRLGNRLQYTLNIVGDLSMVCVPGMLLQPIVENCIKHGFATKVDGGKIVVTAMVSNGRCSIIVEDDGVGWTQKCKNGGIGLANIRERLNLYFSGRCSLEMYNRVGAVVDISFPVEGSCSVL